jgi:predicted nucleic acid-binding protein
MTSSSSPPLERGLDTMLLVYSAVQGHPAAAACEQFLRGHTGWFTSPLVLFEAKATLTKVYGVSAGAATQKLTQLAAVPVTVLPLEEPAALSALQVADTLGVDLTDAVLLDLCRAVGARSVATEDQRLAQVCSQVGLLIESPLGPVLRQQVAAWEAGNLAVKGLARVLRRVHAWLCQTHPQASQDFWTQTGAGTHLP